MTVGRISGTGNVRESLVEGQRTNITKNSISYAEHAKKKKKEKTARHRTPSSG